MRLVGVDSVRVADQRCAVEPMCRDREWIRVRIGWPPRKFERKGLLLLKEVWTRESRHRASGNPPP